ncbi:MAG: hypothetical protein NTY12_00390 [Candidatus Falkowbacteria bacterium]|nr:hypothetical protein [Candidatus Falkowbacteria bacterium]
MVLFTSLIVSIAIVGLIVSSIFIRKKFLSKSIRKENWLPSHIGHCIMALTITIFLAWPEIQSVSMELDKSLFSPKEENYLESFTNSYIVPLNYLMFAKYLNQKAKILKSN